MSKLVNVFPTQPIVAINPPIRTVIRNVRLTTEEIRACLIARAEVEEVLDGGKTVALGLDNYDKETVAAPVVEEEVEHSTVTEAPVEEVKEEVEVTETEVEEEKPVEEPITPQYNNHKNKKKNK